jgi:hypothetical protein
VGNIDNYDNFDKAKRALRLSLQKIIQRFNLNARQAKQLYIEIDENINSINSLESKQQLSKKDFKIFDVRADNHCFKRWQERVGKYIQMNGCSFTPKYPSDIEKFVKNFAEKDGGIKSLTENFYLIDNSIIIVATFEQGIIHINTIYGNCKINPVLKDITKLKQINKQFKRDRANLKLFDFDANELK